MLSFLSAAWLVGIGIGSWLPGLRLSLWPLVAGAMLSAFLAGRWPRLGRTALLILALAAGVWRYQDHLPAGGSGDVSYYNGAGPLRLRGVVDDLPQSRGAAVDLRLRATAVEAGGRWVPVTGGVLVRTALAPVRQYGDLLLLAGPLEYPPRSPEFDYRSYLARQGTRALMDRPYIINEGVEASLPPLSWMVGWRRRLAAALAGALPEPQAALAQGMLLGLRSTLPPELREAFNRTGATHIIAISGQNVAIIGGYLLALGNLVVGRRRSVYFALAGLGVYAVLAGAAPSVIRATVMGGLALLAGQWGRQARPVDFMLLAAAGLALFNPFVLADVGFQLSFLATAGLVLLLPLLAGPVRRLPGLPGAGGAVSRAGRFLAENLAITLVTTAVTAPLLAYYFHSFSLVGVLATLLAVSVLPAIVVTTGITAVLGLVLPAGAGVAGWLSWLFLSYLIGVVETLAALPFAALALDIPLPAVGFYYAALTIGALATDSRAQLSPLSDPVRRAVSRALQLPARWLLVPPGLAAILVWALAFSLPDGHTRVTFLDIGQGDAILVRSQGTTVLIDGGPNPQAVLAHLGRKLPFWQRDLDLVILTHPHEDHLAGLVGVLERYGVGQVVEGGEASGTVTYVRWRELIRSRGIPRVVAAPGQRIALGTGAVLQVLAAPVVEAGAPGGSDGETNEASLVVRLEVGRVSVLLPGDLPPAGQRRLLESGLGQPSAVLKVPHHGAAGALDPTFVSLVAPQIAVISVGHNNRFGQPAVTTLEQLRASRVYRTDWQGNVELVTDGERYWVETQR